MNKTGDHDQDRNPRGFTHNIRPGTPCPETLLVVLMNNGSYLLVGYPQAGPTAFVVRNDAGPAAAGPRSGVRQSHSREFQQQERERQHKRS